MRTPLIIFCASLFAFSAVKAEEAAIINNAHATEIEALWSAGKTSQAEREVSKWMKSDKNSPWPWVQSAIFYNRNKKYKKSLGELKTALEKDPNCAEAYYWRGKNFEAQNKPMEAANEYRAALVASEHFEEAKEALNRVLAVLGSS